MRNGAGASIFVRVPTAARPPAPVPQPLRRMSDQGPNSTDHLEEAGEMVWEAMQTLERAQRVLFRAGDCYVAQVWGDGVRTVIEMGERITEPSGDLMSLHIEIGRLAKKDPGRGSASAD